MKFSVNGVEYLGTEDAASMLGISSSTLRSMLNRGVLPDVKKQRVGRRRKRGFTEDWVGNAKEILQNGTAETAEDSDHA